MSHLDVAAFMFDTANDLAWTGGINRQHRDPAGASPPGRNGAAHREFLGRTFSCGYWLTVDEPDRLVDMEVHRQLHLASTPSAARLVGVRKQPGPWRSVMPTRSDPWPAGTPCWVDLGAPDVAASTAFYGAVMGWTCLDSGAEFGHYNICQVNGQAAAAIGPKQDPNQPTAWTVYLASEDTDATAAKITANGGVLLAEPFDVPGNGRMTIATDPAGAAFGVWQAAGTIGAEIYNEPGGLAWTDARLTDPDTARAFYTAVFGYHYQPLPGAPDHYTTFHLGEAPLGGIGGMMDPSVGLPSHWVAYFSVADTDAAVAAATARGGSLQGVPMDTPFGRMAFLTDPDGAVFALAGPAPGA